MITQKLQDKLDKYNLLSDPSDNWEDLANFLIKFKLENPKVTWNDIAQIVEQMRGISRSESYYRRKYSKGELELLKNSFTPLWNLLMEEDNASINEETKSLTPSQTFENMMMEIKKEKMKVSDERIQANAYLRRIAREETLYEIARQATIDINQQLPLIQLKDSPVFGLNEAILLLSDWHYGMEFKNTFNEYSPEIAKERVAKLLSKVKEKAKFNNVERIHIFNLGDMIAGRIHNTIRYESRFDVITQCMEVSEILAEFIHSLSEDFTVEYYSCLDNHSRLEPIKSDSLDLESLCRITDWYLKERLKNNCRVYLNFEDGYDDMAVASIKGYKILGAHGHKERIQTMIKDLTNFTGQHYDLICTAHRHHFACDEENQTSIVMNSSLMGSDSFAYNLRLKSTPSQTLIIVSDENVVEDICKILL